MVTLGNRLRANTGETPVVQPIEQEKLMSAEDKTKNTAQKVGGKVKEATGKVTGDRSTEAEGKADQAKADVKNAAEKVKDARKH